MGRGWDVNMNHFWDFINIINPNMAEFYDDSDNSDDSENFYNPFNIAD